MTGRPLLTLKLVTSEQPSGVTAPAAPPLPPRPPKREGPLNQMLTFIVVDRKPYHHATYSEADQERNYLQAAHDRRRLRKGHWPKEFRVMKVLNFSGEHITGKLFIDPEHLDKAGVDAACLALYGDVCDTDRVNMAVAVRAYLKALEPTR